MRAPRSPWFWLPTGVAALLGLVVYSLRHKPSPRLELKTDQGIAELLPSLAGLTFGTPQPGNAVEILENAALFDVLLERIAAARHTVHFETFLWKPGRLSTRVVEALCGRARAGVEVRVLLDAQGARRIAQESVRRMREAGCKVNFFHRKSIYMIGRVNDRDHRKIVVLDGREAFVGGHCITDEWLRAGADDDAHFADITLWLHGPIVNTIQSVFTENWGAASRELFVGDKYFPRLEPAGDVLMHAVFSKPEGSTPAVKILYHTAICLARERIWIQNPYFIPEPEAIDAFGEAVRRGVDVRVLMPSSGGSDAPVVQHAGHRNYEKMLKNGMRLFEYPHTMLHQKVMTIDGVWSAVGSTNFDDRSLETNDEISLGILDAGIAGRLDAIFERYAARAREIDLEAWRRRGTLHKLRDHAAYMLNELM